MVREIQQGMDVTQPSIDDKPRYFFGQLSRETIQTAFKVAEVLAVVTAFAGTCFKVYGFLQGKTIQSQDLSDLNDLLSLLQ